MDGVVSGVSGQKKVEAKFNFSTCFSLYLCQKEIMIYTEIFDDLPKYKAGTKVAANA